MQKKKPGYGNLAFTVEIGNHFYVGDATITLVKKTADGRVRVCVSAPLEIAVDRAEVRENKKEQ